MTYLILGGSSGLGRALAEKYAAEGQQLILLSQDHRDTCALAAHLALTHDVLVTPLEMDLNGTSLPYADIDQALLRHSPLKGILSPVGLNDTADEVGLDDSRLERITRVNYLSPCKLINYYLPTLRANSGVIIGFGSVATARGRSRNAAYAAAKRALESYFESLKHYAANSAVSVQFYVLGYLDTNLAFSQKLLFPRADPRMLARLVFERQSRSGKTFYPVYWYLIYHLVRFLPWTIFKRMSF